MKGAFCDGNGERFGMTVNVEIPGELLATILATVTAEATAEVMRVCVTDTEIGIRPEDAQKVFQEFRQVDGSLARQYGGTGLGLALSKPLVEMQGGTINFQSRPGAGTTFTLTLPLADGSAVKNQRKNSRAGGSRRVGPRRSEGTPYRCCLPTLAGFGGFRRMGPNESQQPASGTPLAHAHSTATIGARQIALHRFARCSLHRGNDSCTLYCNGARAVAHYARREAHPSHI